MLWDVHEVDGSKIPFQVTRPMVPKPLQKSRGRYPDERLR